MLHVTPNRQKLISYYQGGVRGGKKSCQIGRGPRLADLSSWLPGGIVLCCPGTRSCQELLGVARLLMLNRYSPECHLHVGASVAKRSERAPARSTDGPVRGPSAWLVASWLARPCPARPRQGIPPSPHRGEGGPYLIPLRGIRYGWRVSRLAMQCVSWRYGHALRLQLQPWLVRPYGLS